MDPVFRQAVPPVDSFFHDVVEDSLKRNPAMLFAGRLAPNDGMGKQEETTPDAQGRQPQQPKPVVIIVPKLHNG